MPYFYFDWTYMVLVLPCIILSLWASSNVKSTFNRYSKQYSSRRITGAEAARMVLESIAYQVADLIHAMEADTGDKLKTLRVDGGASANRFLMQFQSDILGCEVKRPVCIETTSLGAAYLAGLAVGYWKDTAEIQKNWSVDRIFAPQLEQAQRQKRLEGWKKAVARAAAWSEE